ncbi:hypothetical protein fHeYen902_300 [Yersinia phage fHe-Yen9-02]|nr:hypothetical protein fHeYen902_300 [Yersinia phage fHe-Yen9-02]
MSKLDELRSSVDMLDTGLALALTRDSDMNEVDEDIYFGRLGALFERAVERIEAAGYGSSKTVMCISLLILRSIYVVEIMDEKKRLGIVAYQPEREQQIRDRLTAIPNISPAVVELMMQVVEDMRNGQLLDPEGFRPSLN